MPGPWTGGHTGHRQRFLTATSSTDMPKIDAVMHLAGYIEVGDRNPTLGCISPQRRCAAGNARGDGAPCVIEDRILVYRRCLRGTETVPSKRIPSYVPERVRRFQAHVRAVLDWYEKRCTVFGPFAPVLQRGGSLAGGELGEANGARDAYHPPHTVAMAAGGARFEVFGATIRPRDWELASATTFTVMDLAQAHRLGLEWLWAGERGIFNWVTGRATRTWRWSRTCAGSPAATSTSRLDLGGWETLRC